MTISHSHTNDQLLWQQLKAGDADAIDKLMQKYYNDLYTYGLKISSNRSLTKDCIQDLFVKLWHDRERLHEVTFVKTYLLKSLKQNLLKLLSKQSRLTELDKVLENRVEVVFSPEDIFISRQELEHQQEELIQTLNQLPQRHREAIFLKFYEELSNEQIAEVMQLKPQSVYNLIHEALKKLKEKLLLLAILLLPNL